MGQKKKKKELQLATHTSDDCNKREINKTCGSTESLYDICPAYKMGEPSDIMELVMPHAMLKGKEIAYKYIQMQWNTKV